MKDNAMQSKTTPWFDGTTEVPARIGPYERRGLEYSNWNGMFWGLRAPTPEAAARSAYAAYVSQWQDLDWRGLTAPARSRT